MILPRSLFGRNALLLVGLILSAQILTLSLIWLMLVAPQTKRVADIVATSVAAVSKTLDAVPDENRDELLRTLDESPYLTIRPGSRPPPEQQSLPTPLEWMFMQELVDRLSTQTEMDWRAGPGKVIWVQIYLGGEPYWVAAQAPDALEPLTTGLASAALVSLLVLVFGLILTRQIAKPLRTLQAAADGLSLGAPGQPIAVTGPKEIEALGASFDRMSARLAAAEQDRALVLAGVSHDIRTPLAKLRLALEMIPIGYDLRDAAVRQVERIDRLLRQFLDYARGPDSETEREIEIVGLAREVAADCQLDAFEAVTAPPDLWILGYPESLRRALMNLVENAQAHGAPPVTIIVKEEPLQVSIEVRDYGPGLPAGLSESLKTPFRRGPQAMAFAGSGLGLAIVDRVAQQHGGKLILVSADGAGMIGRIEIPRRHLAGEGS